MLLSRHRYSSAGELGGRGAGGGVATPVGPVAPGWPDDRVAQEPQQLRTVTGISLPATSKLASSWGRTATARSPALTLLCHDRNAAGLNGLDVRVSLIPASYQTLPTS